MDKKFNIELSFFCGFYESSLLNSDTLYYELYDDDSMEYYKNQFGADITKDDFDFDYSRLQHDLCKRFSECFKDNADNLLPDLITTLEFEAMTSPKEYNFETDRVFADIEFADNWHEVFAKFFADNKYWLTECIRKEWSSRDGFWSFLENDYDYWVAELAKDEPDERYIGITLGYLMLLADKDIAEHLICDTLEDFYYSEYIIRTKGDK